MRILLLCSKDFNGCLNLNTLLPELAPKHRCGVLLSDREMPFERGNPWADRKFWYEREFPARRFFPALDRLPVTDTPLLTFTGLARRWQVPVCCLQRAQVETDLFRLAVAFRPDLLFCCRFDYILHENVFSLPSLGAYNLHSGLLPQCAGPDATFWAMYLRWDFSACTLHRITARVDGGDIMARMVFPLDYGRSVLWNRAQAYARGIDAFLTLMRDLEAGKKPEGRPQDGARRRYYPLPKEREFIAFHKAGGEDVAAADYARQMRRFLPEGMDLPDCHPPRPRARRTVL